MDELLDASNAMTAVLQTAGPEGMNIVTLVERSLRLLNMPNDPHQMVISMGFKETDIVVPGENFIPTIKAVKDEAAKQVVNVKG